MGLDLGHLEKRRQEIYVWEGRAEDLVDFLNDSGSLQYTGHEILIGESRVAVTEFLVGAVSRIDEGFEPPRDFRYPVEWLHHLIANLRAGDDQERQFGNMVATQVLKLEGKKRQLRLFNEQMLECFNHFSDDFIQQNATVLQAKAITLSKSARLGQVSEEISRGRFEHAAELLKKALDLTDINGNMDEDPRVIYLRHSPDYAAARPHRTPNVRPLTFVEGTVLLTR